MALDLKKTTENVVEQVKDILKIGPTSVIGVDVGLSAIKMAELKKVKDGEYKLVGFSIVALPEASLIEDEIQKEDEIIEALKSGLKKLKSGVNNACVGLSGPNTFARKLQLAGGDYEDIEDQVSWEAEQYLPFNIDDSSLSFHIFGENEGGGVDVLVAAAKNDVVFNFKDVVEASGFKVKIVDLGILALTNIFEYVMGSQIEEPNVSWMIMDLGAQKTEFLIYRNGTIAFSKEIAVGGVMITEEIQRQMGVNYEEAEDLKTTGDESGNLPEEIVEIIDDVVEAFFAEIKKTVDFYVSSTSDENFKECFLTGGGALIPGLVEGLEALLGVDVSILNPFERVDYDKKKFDEDFINTIAFRGVVALGLAMREIKR